jgi:flagellar hook protein FlgE
MTLSWAQTATNVWTVSVNSPDSATPAVGSAQVEFGSTSGNAVASGTVGSLSNATGSMTASSFTAGSPADLTFSTNFGQGPQAISLNLGDFGQTNGLTQYAGTTYSLGGLTQNGVAPGSFSSITTNTSGGVSVNYSNGQSQVIAQVPVVTFAAPNSLQNQNGQSFTATSTSGNPLAQNAGTNGAGSLVTGSIEQSNVDIATQFTALIVAQQAYSANTKVVTSANQMLQQTISMIQ